MFSFWQHANDTPNERLMRAFKIDEADLKANRKGKMTAQQIKVLKRRNVWYFVLGDTPILTVSVIIGTMFMAPKLEPVSIILSIVVFTIILAVNIRLVLNQIGVMQDCREGSVVMSQGLIQRKAGKTYQTIIVHSANLRFSVFTDVYGAFIDGQEYIVYYTPRSKRLVAAEFVAVARVAGVSSHPLYGHLRN